MKMVREIQVHDYPQTIDITFEFIEVSSDEWTGQVNKLVSAIISQAMHDKMSGIRIVAMPAESRMLMEYSRGDSANNRWSVEPPPFHLYPHIVKSLLSLAKLESVLPPTGNLMVNRNGKVVSVRLTIPRIDECLLTW